MIGGGAANLRPDGASPPRHRTLHETKGAVGNLTKGMATVWARHGIQVNAIAPGYFGTPLNAALVTSRTRTFPPSSKSALRRALGRGPSGSGVIDG
jgi:NAD(P)-dependent dehydrogenase (short-subunit alcohol dehydrogenase family)